MDDDFKAKREELRKVADAIDVENDKFSPDGDKVLNGLYNLRKEELELRLTTNKIEKFFGINDNRNILDEIKEQDKPHVRASKVLRNVKRLRTHHNTQKSQIEEHLHNKAKNTSCIHTKIPTPDFGFLIKLSRQLSQQHDIDICLISEDRMLKDKTPAVMSSPQNKLALDELNSISMDKPDGNEKFAKVLEVKPTAQTQYRGKEKDMNALFYLFLKHQLYKS